MRRVVCRIQDGRTDLTLGLSPLLFGEPELRSGSGHR